MPPEPDCSPGNVGSVGTCGSAVLSPTVYRKLLLHGSGVQLVKVAFCQKPFRNYVKQDLRTSDLSTGKTLREGLACG